MPAGGLPVTAVLRLPAGAGPGEIVVAKLAGELDWAGWPALSRCLDDLTARPRPRVVVDLSGVAFADCAGLEPLCRAHRRTAERGGRIAVSGARPLVLRTLRLTGLARHFALYRHLDDAVAALTADDPQALAGLLPREEQDRTAGRPTA